MSIYTVSIHALLAECDVFRSPLLPYPRSFNPRTPCGVRHQIVVPIATSAKFQSTHSLRSATGAGILSLVISAVSIHALLAECDNRKRDYYEHLYSFNPRTPCGVRPKSSRAGAMSRGFQSTHSLRSATGAGILSLVLFAVSIHALLAECDFGDIWI